MKLTIIIGLILSGNLVLFSKGAFISDKKEALKIFSDTCSRNSDPLYDRRKVLDTLASKMNYLAGYYKVNHPTGYSVQSESFYNFFVYDLIDTANNSKKGCVEFLNNHVYHFSSINMRYLYSNVLVLADGRMQFFLGINCKNRINSIDEVIGFLTCHLKNNPQRDVLIDRVRNYKKYGQFYRVDTMSSILCEE